MPNDDSSSLGSDDDDSGLCANCCSDPRGFLSFSASKCTRCGARMATVNLVTYTYKAARTVAGVLTSKEPLRSSGVHTLAVANVPQPLWRDWVSSTSATQSILKPDGAFYLTTVNDFGKFFALQQLNGDKVAAKEGSVRFFYGSVALCLKGKAMSARLALPPGKWSYNKKTGDGKFEYWIGVVHWNPARDDNLVFKLSPAHPFDECSWSADPGSSTPPRASLVASMRKESLRAYALKATVIALSHMAQARVVPSSFTIH